MGDAASAVLVGACAATAAISFATAYLADLLIPVTYKASLAPSAPPKEVDPVIERAPLPENPAPSAPLALPDVEIPPPLSTNPKSLTVG